MRIMFFRKMKRHHIPAVSLRAIWKTVLCNYIKKDEWPLQSPDCNPMDHSVWDSLSAKVYSGRTTVFKEEEPNNTIRQMEKNTSR